MGFLDKTGLQTLTNKLVKGDNIKIESHKGNTVKKVIDNLNRECENVSNPLQYKIENMKTEFYCGSGKDFDFSADVEKGYSEIELKGKTYQNFSPYKDRVFKLNETLFHTGNLELPICLKKNTDYTVILNLKNKSIPSAAYLYVRGNSLETNTFSEYGRTWIDLNSGIKTVKIRNNESIKHMLVAIGVGSFVEVEISNILVLEGDYTNTPNELLPKFFTGIKSSFEDGIVEIETTGKNIIEDSMVSKYDSAEVIEDTLEYIKTKGKGNVAGGIQISLQNKLKPNTKYTFSITCNCLSGGNGNGVRVYDLKNSKYITTHLMGIPYKDIRNIKGTFKTGDDVENLVIWLGKSSDYEVENTFIFYKDWQLEEGTQKTEFEKHKKQTYNLNIGEPLRSLPNGVCDEIRVIDNRCELVRRIKKIQLDSKIEYNIGSESSGWRPQEKTMPFYKYIRDIEKNVFITPYSSVVCNTLNYEYGFVTTERACIGISGGNPASYIGVRLDRSDIISQDSNGFKDWLSKNQTYFYCELATPVITEINPVKFEIEAGINISIKSDVAPYSTHTVQLNRAGQIEKSIYEIGVLKDRIDVLEKIYDTNLLETQHKLSLLGMDYELEVLDGSIDE